MKLMTKRQHQSVQRKIAASIRRIGLERDKLRELIDELEEYENACQDAIEGLESAAYRMSEYA